jgi:hypothetical protein
MLLAAGCMSYHGQERDRMVVASTVAKKFLQGEILTESDSEKSTVLQI